MLESRREWLLNAFKKAGAANPNNAKNQFWQQHNQPIELWSAAVIQQKSARDYCGTKGLVKVIID